MYKPSTKPAAAMSDSHNGTLSPTPSSFELYTGQRSRKGHLLFHTTDRITRTHPITRTCKKTLLCAALLNKSRQRRRERLICR